MVPHIRRRAAAEAWCSFNDTLQFRLWQLHVVAVIYERGHCNAVVLLQPLMILLAYRVGIHQSVSCALISSHMSKDRTSAGSQKAPGCCFGVSPLSLLAQTVEPGPLEFSTSRPPASQRFASAFYILCTQICTCPLCTRGTSTKVIPRPLLGTAAASLVVPRGVPPTH